MTNISRKTSVLLQFTREKSTQRIPIIYQTTTTSLVYFFVVNSSCIFHPKPRRLKIITSQEYLIYMPIPIKSHHDHAHTALTASGMIRLHKGIQNSKAHPPAMVRQMVFFRGICFVVDRSIIVEITKIAHVYKAVCLCRSTSKKNKKL